jgi:hypothetical protein
MSRCDGRDVKFRMERRDAPDSRRASDMLESPGVRQRLFGARYYAGHPGQTRRFINPDPLLDMQAALARGVLVMWLPLRERDDRVDTRRTTGGNEAGETGRDDQYATDAGEHDWIERGDAVQLRRNHLP